MLYIRNTLIKLP